MKLYLYLEASDYTKPVPLLPVSGLRSWGHGYVLPICQYSFFCKNSFILRCLVHFFVIVNFSVWLVFLSFFNICACHLYCFLLIKRYHYWTIEHFERCNISLKYYFDFEWHLYQHFIVKKWRFYSVYSVSNVTRIKKLYKNVFYIENFTDDATWSRIIEL